LRHPDIQRSLLIMEEKKCQVHGIPAALVITFLIGREESLQNEKESKNETGERWE
jgi:hypothetical protein